MVKAKRVVSFNYLVRLVGLGIAILGLAGCGESNHLAPPASETALFQGKYPIRAVCTTGMVADLVRAIAGDRVEVRTLMGPGTDPHTYIAVTSDLAALESADVVFYSGLHLEGKMGEVLEHLGRRHPCLAVAETLPKEDCLAATALVSDPHVWFDVRLWLQCGAGVQKFLSRFDAPNAPIYEANYARLRKQYEDLDTWCRHEIQRIPKSQRVLVTAHDAFRYFESAYGVQVRAVQGVSTETEAGVKEVNDLVQFLVARKIKAVFIESTLNPRNVESLVEGCKARGHAVKVGGNLYSDAMGERGSGAETYESMVRHNVRTIVEALR